MRNYSASRDGGRLSSVYIQNVKLAHLRNCTAAKDSLQDCEAAAHDDIIADVLHDACSLSSHQRQQNGGYQGQT